VLLHFYRRAPNTRRPLTKPLLRLLKAHPDKPAVHCVSQPLRFRRIELRLVDTEASREPPGLLGNSLIAAPFSCVLRKGGPSEMRPENLVLAGYLGTAGRRAGRSALSPSG